MKFQAGFLRTQISNQISKQKQKPGEHTHATLNMRRIDIIGKWIHEKLHWNNVKAVKNGKAAGSDGIFPEFIKNLGPKGKIWLTILSTVIVSISELPKLWNEIKVILKLGKAANNARSYRSISLLPTVFKVFERLLLQRL